MPCNATIPEGCDHSNSVSKIVSILGAGGHARSLVNLLERGRYRIGGIYDASFEEGECVAGYPVLGKLDDIPAGTEIVISVGENAGRRRLFEQFGNRVLSDNLVHGNAEIERDVRLGVSNQIFSRAYLNRCVQIGADNIINTNALLEHEVAIGDHNHISVGAILCGRVRVGSLCFIGAGAVVIDKVRICDSVIVGANSVVIRDISEPGTYVGSPVRRVG